MSTLSELIHGLARPVCLICGAEGCSHLNGNPRNVYFEADEMPERLYTVRARVRQQGRILYQPGQQIPLSEAVRLDLPGAAEMAVNATPLDRKQMHSQEDREIHPASNR